MRFIKLRYIDHRPLSMNFRRLGGRFTNLKQGEIYEVTEAEASVLLKRKNGTKPAWERVGGRQSGEAADGNR